jgi:thiaminase/transcriptional activator TenA
LGVGVTAQALIESEAELWEAATHHPFLDGVRDGTLPAEAFGRWLAQDYHFGAALTRAEGRYLAGAPREDLALLAAGIQAMVAELEWFEQKAAEREIELGAPLHPTARAYVDYLFALCDRPYSVQLTALWALERAYLDAWRGARPGAGAYREFVEHWTNEDFAAYVAALEAATSRALGQDPDAEREAFRQVARLERAFWAMAFEGGDG